MARRVNTGVELYVEEGGSPGPTLLLLHGLGATGDVWKRMVPLVEKNWKGRWLIPDFRGHGRSAHRGPYSYAAHAADVAGLLKQDEEVTVAGHSMGGAVAIALATGWFGFRVNRARLRHEDQWTPEETAKFNQVAAAPVRWFDTEAEAVERYLKVSGLIGLVAADGRRLAAVCAMKTVAIGSRPIRESSQLASGSQNLLRAARSPFRLAAGSKDAMVELSHMTPFDPQAVIFDGLGHNAHVEDPKKVWAFIREE